MTIEMNAIEQYVPVILYIMLKRAVLTFESDFLGGDQSNMKTSDMKHENLPESY